MVVASFSCCYLDILPSLTSVSLLILSPSSHQATSFFIKSISKCASLLIEHSTAIPFSIMIGAHGDVVHHLVRRGVEASARMQSSEGSLEAVYQIPTGAIIVLGLSAVLCLVFLTSVRYTLWGVVATLAEVETPQNTLIIKEEKAADGVAIPNEEAIEAEVAIVKQKPITSKIRTTIRHLHARAGFAARWRGLSLFIVYALAHGLLSGFIANMFGAFHYPGMGSVFLVKSIGSVMATITLARFSTAWVHIVISEPSPKPWYRRVPNLQSWKNVWAPSAVVDITTRVAFALPALCAIGLGLNPDGIEGQHPGMVAFKVLVCVLLGLMAVVALVIPSTVALVRVQASMLPEEDESIVPFDRTFGGKVVPEILGGSGAIGFLDAWRTFDMAARARIIKLFFKFIAVEIGLHLFLVAVLGAEAFILISPEHVRRVFDQ